MGILDNEKAYVDFLCTHKLTTNQFLLCYLIYTEKMVRDREGSLKFQKAGNIIKWINEGTGWYPGEVEDLIEKGYLVDTTKKGGGEMYEIDRLILTSKFVDLLFVNANFAFDEIFEIYPNSINIKGETFFLKGVDPDIVSDLHRKAIKNSLQKHNEIKELIIYGKEQNLINMRIDKFYYGRIWESIKKTKEERSVDGYGKTLY